MNTPTFHYLPEIDAISTVLDSQAAMPFAEFTRSGGDAFLPDFWGNTFRVAPTRPSRRVFPDGPPEPARCLGKIG